MNVYHQSQQILLDHSTHDACVGHTDHSHALNTRYTNLKTHCICTEFMRSHKVYKSH